MRWSDSPPARAKAWIGWIGIWAQYPCRCPSIDSPFESPLGVPERDRALLVFIRVYLRFSGANIIAQAVTLCHCLRTAWRHFQIVAHGGSKFRHLAVLTADPRKWDQRNPKSPSGKLRACPGSLHGKGYRAHCHDFQSAWHAILGDGVDATRSDGRQGISNGPGAAFNASSSPIIPRQNRRITRRFDMPSIGHGLIDHRPRLAPDHFELGSRTLSHQYSHQLGLRIDPEQRAGNSAPGKVANRTWHGIAAGIDANGEAQAKTGTHFRDRTKGSEHRSEGRVAFDGGRELIGRHQRDRLRPQNALAIEFAAIEQHLAEARIIARGG